MATVNECWFNRLPTNMTIHHMFPWSYLFTQQFLPLFKAQRCFINFWGCTWWSGVPRRRWLFFWGWFSLWCRLPLWRWFLLWCRFSRWGANLFRRLFCNWRYHYSWRWRLEAICCHSSGVAWRQWSGWTCRRLATSFRERTLASSWGFWIHNGLMYPSGRRVNGDPAFCLEAWSPILASPTSFLNICGFHPSCLLQFSQLRS